MVIVVLEFVFNMTRWLFSENDNPNGMDEKDPSLTSPTDIQLEEVNEHRTSAILNSDDDDDELLTSVEDVLE